MPSPVAPGILLSREASLSEVDPTGLDVHLGARREVIERALDT